MQRFNGKAWFENVLDAVKYRYWIFSLLCHLLSICEYDGPLVHVSEMTFNLPASNKDAKCAVNGLGQTRLCSKVANV